MDADQRRRAAMVAPRLSQRAMDEGELEVVDELLEVGVRRDRFEAAGRRVGPRGHAEFVSVLHSVWTEVGMDRRQGIGLSVSFSVGENGGPGLRDAAVRRRRDEASGTWPWEEIASLLD